jgi:Arc-like DNA binding domain
MSTRIGPFSLRLPVTIKLWLEDAARENNRSVTSEAIYRLVTSLKKDYSDHEVTTFKQASPTSINNDAVGLRLPSDLKTLLREQAKAHKNSLNQEIVMRLTDAYQLSSSYQTIQKISEPDFVSDTKYTLSVVEQDLIETYRKLSDEDKSVVIKISKKLAM